MVKQDPIEAGQPEVNIGLAGHVDTGKTSLLFKLSGKWADTHSEEIKRGITIRLGYADAIFYSCHKCDNGYSITKKCPKCEAICKAIRKVSFVDAPGHETLMATMLSGAAIMDGVLLLVAANEKCPQPQTEEHLIALTICGVKKIVVVQNKIDLVSEEEALKNYNEIKEFLNGTIAENAPIIPLSAQQGVNMDCLIEAIEKDIPTPKRDFKKNPLLLIARSFDINKPGMKVRDLVGGVLGGVLKQGILKLGDEIEIKPGLKIEKEGRTIWEPIKTKITGLKSGGEDLKEVGPGGSIGLLTSLDPCLVKSDKLTSNVCGHVGKLPLVWHELKLEPNLLQRVVGSKKELKVESIKKGEVLMLNVSTSPTVGVVTELSKKIIKATLKFPVCAEKEEKVAISRRIENRFRLIGFGIIKG